VTQPTKHIDDEILSAFVDNQITPDEVAHVQEHLATCAECSAHFDGFQGVAQLLRGLPEIEPPRDLALGPRLVADPPNVIRLQRWYTATRAVAASLAAVWVLLSVGALYVDSRPSAATSAQVAQPRLLASPSEADGSDAAPPALNQPATAPQASPAPQAPVRAAAPQSAGAAAAKPATTPQADDQVAATTSVRTLPTLPPPTLAPTPRPASAPPFVQPAASSDPAAFLRAIAEIVGVLAVLALVAAMVVRRRLQHQSIHP
jgi:hypothetical protein